MLSKLPDSRRSKIMMTTIIAITNLSESLFDCLTIYLDSICETKIRWAMDILSLPNQS